VSKQYLPGQFRALQKITVLVIGAETEIRIVQTLVGLADLATARQGNVSILIKRDEFDRIPRIVALAGSDKKPQFSS
jgi:hypothetical protein